MGKKPFLFRSHVARRGDQLVLNLPHARPSGCLIVDLRELPHVYFTVRKTEGGAVLGYANAQGDFTALAQFSDATEADKVLRQIVGRHMWLSDLLRFTAKLLVGLVLITLFLFTLNYILDVINASSAGGQHSSAPQAQSETQGLRTRPPAGVPVDADERLGQ